MSVVAQDVAEIEARLRDARIDAQCTVQKAKPCLQLSGSPGDQPQQMESIGLVGRDLENAAVEPCGNGKPAALMMLYRGRERLLNSRHA